MVGHTFGLEHLEFTSFGNIYRNLTVEELVEHEFTNGEGKFGPNGAMMVTSGEHPERLPECKFYLDEPSTTENIWWGSGNKAISQQNFNTVKGRALSYLSGKNLYLHDGYSGADPEYKVPVRVVSEKAWHAHVFQNHLLPASDEELVSFKPDITVINAAGYQEYEYEKYGLHSKEFVLLDVKSGMIIVGGTENSDELKMAVFSMLNYILPLKGILTVHAAANVGKENDVALLMGSQESGKTTLCHDPNKRSWHRRLIGDDNHGWSEKGIFNLENGCYAKVNDLVRESEPDIFQAIRFGAILENCTHDAKRMVDYADGSKTLNSRVCYPQHFIHNSVIPGLGDHPQNLIILANDMSGVLPPIAKLTTDQAVYYFLSGYSCSLSIKDRQLASEPEFSFCFGSTFLPLRPNIYAELLAQKLERHGIQSFMINTGMTGGDIATGNRIPIVETRKILEAILDKSLENSIFEKDPIFGFEIPKQLTSVNSQILIPRESWQDPAAYDEARGKLATMFIENFEAYAQDGPQTGDVIAVKYLYNEYNKLAAAGPHL